MFRGCLQTKAYGRESLGQPGPGEKYRAMLKALRKARSRPHHSGSSGVSADVLPQAGSGSRLFVVGTKCAANGMTD